MAGWLLRESGVQRPGSAKSFECGVHGALTQIRECQLRAAGAFLKATKWRLNETCITGLIKNAPST